MTKPIKLFTFVSLISETKLELMLGFCEGANGGTPWRWMVLAGDAIPVCRKNWFVGLQPEAMISWCESASLQLVNISSRIDATIDLRS